MKVVRAKVTDDEFADLKKYTTHLGEISHIIRSAIKIFIKARKQQERDGTFRPAYYGMEEVFPHATPNNDARKEASVGGGTTTPKVHTGRRSSR